MRFLPLQNGPTLAFKSRKLPQSAKEFAFVKYMPEVQNTLTKHTNKQSCSKPNAIIHSGQGAMAIHISCASMLQGNVLP